MTLAEVLQERASQRYRCTACAVPAQAPSSSSTAMVAVTSVSVLWCRTNRLSVLLAVQHISQPLHRMGLEQARLSFRRNNKDAGYFDFHILDDRPLSFSSTYPTETHPYDARQYDKSLPDSDKGIAMPSARLVVQMSHYIKDERSSVGRKLY